MSFSGSSDTTWAAASVPSAKVTWMPRAPATTWRAVRMAPSALMTTPVPSPLESPSPPSRSARMNTSDGRIARYTSAESGGAALASSMPWSTADLTAWLTSAGDIVARSDERPAAHTASTRTTRRPIPMSHGHVRRTGDAGLEVSALAWAGGSNTVQSGSSARDTGTVPPTRRARRCGAAR